ncbi:MAG TPA: sugar phosphate isomerase/epimerase family protein [Lacipirellulaceae bacterium]|jgi:sugar phosphate isomerase/epimerase|nr:sugar phosphate isomerase/epimerase family protein [Lacipirellulaceae bacterium]
MEKWPIGVFASIDAGLGVRLEVARDLGVHTVHLHTPHAESRTPERAAEFNKRLADLDITITCVFAGFEGESYADIPTVKKTVGLMPRETRAARAKELKEIADFARKLNVDVVGVHLGFVPHDKADADYRELLDITRDVCDHCKRNRQALHLETGQEPVDVLIAFLDDVDRDNIFVNFDPANMILYGAGEPIPALEQLGPRVHCLHCKDATWSDKPGETWGAEVPLGEGAVDFTAFLNTLNKIGYTGPLTIEREIPQEPERQKAEIGRAIDLLTRLKQQIK